MKIFKSPKNYTLNTLVPGVILTRRSLGLVSYNEGETFIVLAIKHSATSYPMTLKNLGSGHIDNHRLYNDYGHSFWNEIEDIIK